MGTETFAGSSYLELCSGCADSMADGGTNTDTGSEIQTDGNFGGGFDLKRGEQLMLGSATKFDAQLSVVVDQVALFNDGSTPATVGVSSTAGALGTMLPPSPPTATLPSTRCTTPPATSPSLSPSPPPTPTTSTSPSAPTVAVATAPPASAAASRATPTTTATPRTCSPPKSAASAQSRSAAVRASK